MPVSFLDFLQNYGTSSSPSTSSSGPPGGPPTPQGYPVRSTGPQSQPPQRPPAPGGAPPSTYSYPGQRPPMYPGNAFTGENQRKLSALKRVMHRFHLDSIDEQFEFLPPDW